MALEQAIRISKILGREHGWLYRDWGHILARYQRYAEAKEALQQAEERTLGDASIIATSAYIAWREGDDVLAEELFERALGINPNHTYSLKYFAILLRTLGRVEHAGRLQERLDALEDGTADDLFVVDELDDEDEI